MLRFLSLWVKNDRNLNVRLTDTKSTKSTKFTYMLHRYTFLYGLWIETGRKLKKVDTNPTIHTSTRIKEYLFFQISNYRLGNLAIIKVLTLLQICTFQNVEFDKDTVPGSRLAYHYDSRTTSTNASNR